MTDYKLEMGGRELVVNMNELAEMANGSCSVRYGDTVVLSTAVMSQQERDLGFFPLTVDYEERYYAAGKILGSRYIRRESRPSDEAILTSRLIDRAIRPLFPPRLRKEIQVILTCLSWDRENDPDILGLMGASLSLSVSNIPWSGPVACLRIGREQGSLILNPTYKQREASDLDLVLAGVERRGEIFVNMIEAEGDQIPEEIILAAYKFAEPELKKIIAFQNKIAEDLGQKKASLKESKPDLELEKEIKKFLGKRLKEALFNQGKKERGTNVNELKEELAHFIESEHEGENKTELAREFFEKEIDKLIHQEAIKEEKRVDGRKLDEIRQISTQVGLLPRTHGSGLFQRGQTKTLSILTLGAPGDVKLLEGMEIVGKKRFMHHYNFPPYSVGEVRPLRGPGRRDIGHGMLVEKALLPVVPDVDQFPYTIRVVSEILSSNGSTSMASCSSASLALMDAGVPTSAAVAGISIGLMQEGRNYKLLVDIQGPEDHHGDMDFKVAGTKNGITAIQMDVKIAGISKEVLEESLSLAKKIRIQILDKMAQTLPSPRQKLSPLAPRILTLQINPEKIREVIGPGGKVINKIIQDCGVLIDIEDSGLVFVTSEKEESALQALDWIKNIVREAKPGEVFEGKVKRILDFGAFVEILPGQEGMIHISQLAPHRVRRVEDVVKVGDTVQVKVLNIDEQGRINLTLLQGKQNTKAQIISSK
ncbi:MAG: polyribonucleotide nucleotidyltransferase [Parcubacteria group bacterium Gr01-1014_30]|nr:MAG: polyribonucleotide nucleotidyltransferase [Parcubacteria group bacterium Gr01-1014_30]